jgi:hypothetical protein
MARCAEVASRPEGPIFMGAMAAALVLGDWRDVPDATPIAEPGWTLFAFDLAAGEAVFLDTGALDLSAVPFSYAAQYEGARRLLRMGLDQMIALSAGIAAGPPMAHLFNMGHCGSTLLHHVVNRSGAAWCVSEPLFLFDLAMGRASLSAERQSDLARAGLAFLRLWPGGAGRPILVKHFSQSTTILPAFHAADPAARHVFLYRGAEDWCNSGFGFAQRMGVGPEMDEGQRRFTWWIMTGDEPVQTAEGLVDFASAETGFEEGAALAWAVHLRDVRAAMAGGMRFHFLRYEELVAHRMASLEALFAYLGVTPVDMTGSLTAFDADAHEGTATASSVPVQQLGADARARIARLLAHPRLALTGDVILG